MGTPSSPEEARHQHYQTVASATTSVLSIIGAFYIIGRYWYARRLKAKALSVYAASAHHLDVTKELIHIIAYLDLFGATGRAFGVLPTETFDQDAGDPVTPICKLQAFIITFGDGAPIAWNFIMALNLYRWVCMGEDQQMLMKKIKYYIVCTMLFTLGIPSICLIFNKFGDAGLWCWVVVQDDTTEELWWMFGVLYFWVIAGGIAMTVFLVLVKINMKKRLKTYENDDANDAYYAVVHNLTVYISGFILCWLPAVVDRGYATFTGKTSFTLDFLHATIVPLQGFINAVIYGKFHIWVVRHVREPWASSGGSSTKNSKLSEDLLRQSVRLREQERHHMGTASIFVTTFDMNWTSCPTNLEDWIPAGKDLYVFSLQHCVEVQTIEQVIRGYLLQVNYPTAYRSITSIAGTAVRGHVQDASVCQIVFVNNADDASGNAKFQAADGRIWAQRKTFNEVVGIPIRYFDASIAFVSCNLGTSLSSSSQRQYRPENNMFAKHAVASSLVHSFGMDADRAAVDFPNLYHHTILSGNLNYDVDMSNSTLAASLDQAYKAESLKRSTDTAIEAQIKAIRDAKTSKKNADLQHDQSILEEGSDGWDSLRSSAEASSSRSGDSIYEEVYTSCESDVPFTLLKSPADLSRQPVLHTPFLDDRDPDSLAIIIHEGVEEPEEVNKHNNWASFLDDQLPSRLSEGRQALSASASKQRSSDRLASSGHFVPLARGNRKKIRDLLSESDLVTENTARKWLEVLRYDELRASIEAKEIFTGFEEPPIRFLPTFPRKIGVAATFSMVGERSCRDLFCEADEEMLVGDSPPAYKDRILAHSLSDTKQRIRNVGYWSCENIVTSTHKPVCSIYELEIDRFFSYNMDEAAVADLRQGNHALRDKRDVHEFKIKLVKLDANIWTYEDHDRGSVAQTTGYRWRGHGSNQSSSRTTAGHRSQNSRGAINSNSTTSSGESSHHSVRISMSRRKSSIAQAVGRVLRKSRLRSGSGSSSRTTMTTPNQYSDFTAGPAGTQPLAMTSDRLSALAASRLELVPVEPISISTIFPLPSEDVYALQRKVYEVAHLVQNGFQSSARVDDDEESQLAYTNFRTVSWREAMSNGVTHSAITKAVNGGVHIAISIEAEKGHGGQGVLCLKESDLMMHAAPVLSEAEPIPFDVTLTWGGKHVGYLHGDILCSM
nr:Phytopthora agathidicda GPCR-INPP 1 [Phytophthora agathidicida]